MDLCSPLLNQNGNYVLGSILLLIVVLQGYYKPTSGSFMCSIVYEVVSVQMYRTEVWKKHYEVSFCDFRLYEVCLV